MQKHDAPQQTNHRACSLLCFNLHFYGGYARARHICMHTHILWLGFNAELLICVLWMYVSVRCVSPSSLGLILRVYLVIKTVRFSCSEAFVCIVILFIQFSAELCQSLIC